MERGENGLRAARRSCGWLTRSGA